MEKLRKWIIEHPIWSISVLAAVFAPFFKEVFKDTFLGFVSDAVRNYLLGFFQRGPAMTGTEYVLHVVSFVICLVGVCVAVWIGRILEAEKTATASKATAGANIGSNGILSVLRYDTWFSHAAFYVAYGFWPDTTRPLSNLSKDESQIPEFEHLRLADATHELRQKAYQGDLQVWGKNSISWGAPRKHDLFKQIPKDHWETYEVQYLHLFKEPNSGFDYARPEADRRVLDFFDGLQGRGGVDLGRQSAGTFENRNWTRHCPI